MVGRSGGLGAFLGLLVFSVGFLPAKTEGHPGYCLLLPWRHPAPSGGGSCSVCSVDVDCPPEKKCCGSACGNTCQAPASSVCQLPPAVGPCKARIRQFYYHWANKRCERFDYGGCLGNLNRFETQELCRQACGGPVVTGSL